MVITRDSRACSHHCTFTHHSFEQKSCYLFPTVTCWCWTATLHNPNCRRKPQAANTFFVRKQLKQAGMAKRCPSGNTVQMGAVRKALVPQLFGWNDAFARVVWDVGAPGCSHPKSGQTGPSVGKFTYTNCLDRWLTQTHYWSQLTVSNH